MRRHLHNGVPDIYRRNATATRDQPPPFAMRFLHALEEVLDLAKRSETSIYTIGLRGTLSVGADLFHVHRRTRNITGIRTERLDGLVGDPACEQVDEHLVLRVEVDRATDELLEVDAVALALELQLDALVAVGLFQDAVRGAGTSGAARRRAASGRSGGCGRCGRPTPSGSASAACGYLTF